MSRRVAFVFPGQGSQFVGMGASWAETFPAARRTFEEADDALGMALSELCWSGPAEDLQLTINTQPALLATAVATLRVLQELEVEPVVMAGHSLGEYAAHVAAGSLEFRSALQLVRHRGEFMQEAVPVGKGAMAAILSLDSAEVEAAAAEAASDREVCVVANYNAPDQTVIAGDSEAVRRAIELCRGRGARRAVLLPVSAPFHSPLMAPARQRLSPLLREASFADPAVPVVTNVDAAPVAGGEEARDALIRQVDGPVRWVESVRWMAGKAAADLFVEVGAGKVLSGLNRRIVPEAETISLSEPAGLEKLKERLGSS